MSIKIENSKCLVLSFTMFARLVSRGASENLLKIFRPNLFAFIEEFFFFRVEDCFVSSSSLRLAYLSCFSGAASEGNETTSRQQ